MISLSPVPLPAGTWGTGCSQGTGGSKGIFLGGEQQDVQKLRELFRACVEITPPSAFQPKAGGLCPWGGLVLVLLACGTLLGF